MNKLGYNAIAAIMGIVLLTFLALAMGYDGILFLTAIGIISGLGGYPVAKSAFQSYKDNLENPMATYLLQHKRKGPPGS